MISRVNAADLDVHLQAGDSLLGAGNLEIHVAVMIFGAGDIGQDGVLIAFLHQAHGDAGHRSLDRHAGIHQRKDAAADRGHGGGSVAFQNVGNHANGVRECLFA